MGISVSFYRRHFILFLFNFIACLFSAKLNADVLLGAERETRKGKEYFKINTAKTVKKLEIDFDKANLEFEDIFKNNEELTKNTNRIISENIHEIFNELRPVIDETVSKFVVGTIGDLFNRYSLEDLFPVTLNTV